MNSDPHNNDQVSKLGRELVSAARTTEPFTGARLERGLRRIAAAKAHKSTSWHQLARSKWLWVPAALLLSMGGALSAVLLRKGPQTQPDIVAPAISPNVTAPVATPAPATEPAVIVKDVTQPSQKPRSRPVPAAIDVSALARESDLLGRAVTALRQKRAPEEALALLSGYQTQFPNGTLALEANLASVDAHLAMGNHAKALTLLERLPIDKLPRAAEMSVIRGELLAEANRCKGSLPDFARALMKQPGADLRARALHGRGVCLWRMGNRAQAKIDLEQYLTLEPQGRFANDVRSLLRATPDE